VPLNDPSFQRFRALYGQWATAWVEQGESYESEPEVSA
jgi:hypothetical protein